MTLTANEVSNILSSWINPSSESEQDRQDRAERMIRSAIEASNAFQGSSYTIFAKGSYANNTNVRLDSDVDIVVQCNDCLYYDYAPGVSVAPSQLPPYAGKWTPTGWRTEIATALVNYFGSSEVDTTGNVAIRIKEKPGSRPSADVVPSFSYRLYWTTERDRFADGSVVYKSNAGRIVNWPCQQLENGQQKNVRTGRRYKYFVRALKNAENTFASKGQIAPKPSYLMECLGYNVSDVTLQSGANLSEAFRASLGELWNGLEGDQYKSWLEPNGIKYAFHESQKWTHQDARLVVSLTWNYLYG